MKIFIFILIICINLFADTIYEDYNFYYSKYSTQLFKTVNKKEFNISNDNFSSWNGKIGKKNYSVKLSKNNLLINGKLFKFKDAMIFPSESKNISDNLWGESLYFSDSYIWNGNLISDIELNSSTLK